MEDKLAEFRSLSTKVSDKTATDEERARWRTLRAELARPAPPLPAGQVPRAHPRACRKLRVSYAPVSELTVTFSDEIGVGGLRLRVPRHLEPGTLLVLRLDVPNAAPSLTVEARVVWSRREGGHFTVGVELPNLPPGEAERLEALLHEKA